tara:strand:- start:476 stop:754 length:279 start_codon:yes stop_codon:yes gene_type:complete
MKKIFSILLLVVVLSLSGCFHEKWEGFVYPNKNDLTAHINIGIYETLDQCRTASLQTLSRLHAIKSGDYECGLNCKWGAGIGSIKICEKTEH